MATLNTYTGNGSQTLYSITFEYLDETDVNVRINGSETSAYTFANATTIQFDTAPANGDDILIYRSTDVSEPIVTFFAGSAIRAQDLNKANDQIRFSVEEWRGQTVPLYDAVLPDDINMGGHQINNMGEPTSSHDAATKNYVDTTTWNVTTETLQVGETWVSDDTVIATAGAIDDRIDDKIDIAITNDIGTDGTGITVTDDGDGTITLGLAANSIDFDRLKNVDIITEAEQTAQSPSWGDSYISTAAAIANRHDLVVSNSAPTTTQIGKLWFNNTTNVNSLNMWDGSNWKVVTSGTPYIPQGTTIVRYVDSVNGSDAIDVTGFLPQAPLQSIKRALTLTNASATGDGTLILVAPGVYQETLPLRIQKNNVSIVGTSLRSCFVHPTVATETNNMFEVDSGSYIANLTLLGLKVPVANQGSRNNPLDNDATYGLPNNQPFAVRFRTDTPAVIIKSPYIQNCTNFCDAHFDNANFDPNTFPATDAQTYSAVAGDQSSAPTGGGLLIDGSAVSSSSPLRSMVVDSFTQICLDGPGVLVTNNGYAQLVSFFGTFTHYHAKAKNGGQINLSNCVTDFGRYGLIADGKSPSSIASATITSPSAGAGNGSTTVTIGAITTNPSFHGTVVRPLNHMMITIDGVDYGVVSSVANGGGWDVTLSSPLTSNISSATANFALRSYISTGGHTFEFVGVGTNYSDLPDNGGVPIEANQVIELNGGKVWQSSTDQVGKFKAGSTLVVDQVAETVSLKDTNVTGDITVTGTVDGRDVATDGIKLDGISAGANVYTNSDVDTHLNTGTANTNEVLSWNGTDYDWVVQSGGGGGGGGATPAGVSGSIQIHDGLSPAGLGYVTDFKWDTANTELDVPGDISLDDGGTYTTTIQSITATANRFISFPDQTGVVSLVSGINGAVQFNNAGYTGGSALVVDATTKAFGYGSDGGTVTQATNKSTGVTLNKPTGRITMNAAALAANTTVSFTLTNSSITENDLLILNHVSGGTAGSYLLNAQAAAGSASINVRNITAGSLSEAIVIGFAVIKATTT